MSQELSHRLFNYSAAPPSRNWEAIASAIDDQMSVTASALEAYQQPAPPQLWDKIAVALEETSPVVGLKPVKKPWSLPVRTISAAAILVVVATLITLYINKAEPSGQVARQPATAQSGRSLPAPDSGSQEHDEESPRPTKQSSPTPGGESAPLAASKVNRYVVMAQDDGQTVRLSKKAFTVFDCAENSAPHNKERCKENIQLMQQKMAASMLSPSGDFGGLIDMIKSLEENE